MKPRSFVLKGDNHIWYTYYMYARKTRHSKYNLNYHFVWIPKYRRKILVNTVKQDLETLLNQCAAKNDLEILSLSIQPNHVHLFVSAPPRYSPSKLINLFKGFTARELRKSHQYLAQRKSLWTRSYYVGTAGTVSSETIEHYILECQDE